MNAKVYPFHAPVQFPTSIEEIETGTDQQIWLWAHAKIQYQEEVELSNAIIRELFKRFPNQI